MLETVQFQLMRLKCDISPFLLKKDFTPFVMGQISVYLGVAAETGADDGLLVALVQQPSVHVGRA